MSRKIMVLVNCVLILAALSGLAYSHAHWSETININGCVKTAHWKTVIGSWKVVTPPGYDEYHPVIEELLPDNRTLRLTCGNVTEGWCIWVGLLIHNEGDFTVDVKNATCRVEDPALEQYFTYTTYLYGPYDQSEFNEVWDGVVTDISDLPVLNATKGPRDSPVTLYHCQHAVTWTKIAFQTSDPEASGKTVQIRVTIVDDPTI